MPTLATLTGGGPSPSDANASRASVASSAVQRSCPSRSSVASLTVPALGITVSFSSKGLHAATGLANAAVKLGSESVQLIGDAAQTVSDAAGSVVQGGVMAAVAGNALLATLG
ncbi:hypothetical protein [Roseateles sp.]|uniref:hypothetical protein n=1 Tax=Roseateles sp. TaxID=1971397 RepID=UPI003BAADD7D